MGLLDGMLNNPMIQKQLKEKALSFISPVNQLMQRVNLQENEALAGITLVTTKEIPFLVFVTLDANLSRVRTLTNLPIEELITNPSKLAEIEADLLNKGILKPKVDETV